jgi:hypothetical protein
MFDLVFELISKDNELQHELDQLDKLGEMGGGAHKQRLINVLNKQIEQRESLIGEKRSEIEGLEKKLGKSREKIDQVIFTFYYSFNFWQFVFVFS